MSNFARKLQRKNKHLTKCCGKQMAQKEFKTDNGYETYYCCEYCGKSIKKDKIERRNVKYEISNK